MKDRLVRYWKWIVAFVALMGVIAWALLKELFSSKPHDPVVEQKKIDEEYERRVEELKKEEAKKIEQVDEEHDKDVTNIEQVLEDKTKKIEDDPKAVNDFLKEVGKDLRG